MFILIKVDHDTDITLVHSDTYIPYTEDEENYLRTEVHHIDNDNTDWLVRSGDYMTPYGQKFI